MSTVRVIFPPVIDRQGGECKGPADKPRRATLHRSRGGLRRSRRHDKDEPAQVAESPASDQSSASAGVQLLRMAAFG